MEKFDLLVYGATGFTGRQAAEVLGKAALKNNFKMALAGRNREKLLQVRKSLAANLGCPVDSFEVLVADSQSLREISDLVSKTKVIANFAGPFAKYAPLIIEQCAVQGKDYVDITGEVAFISRMIHQHQDKALKSGARIIPLCGFDSIPSDLGTFWAFHQWKKSRKPNEKCASIHSYFQMKGGFNGGSLATMMDMAKSGDSKLLNKNLWLLCPPKSKLPPATADLTAPKRIRELGGYSAPFFMAPINTRVVRRSQSLFGGEFAQFEYGESILVKENVPIQSGMLSAFGAVLGSALKSRLLQPHIEKMLPKPGSGPTTEQMDNGFFKTTYIVKGTEGTLWKGAMSAKGDPGNRATVQLISEAALCLILPESRAKIPLRTGFLTPAYAFENVLVDRLKQSGVKFELLN